MGKAICFFWNFWRFVITASTWLHTSSHLHDLHSLPIWNTNHTSFPISADHGVTRLQFVIFDHEYRSISCSVPFTAKFPSWDRPLNSFASRSYLYMHTITLRMIDKELDGMYLPHLTQPFRTKTYKERGWNEDSVLRHWTREYLFTFFFFFSFSSSFFFFFFPFAAFFTGLVRRGERGNGSSIQTRKECSFPASKNCIV